MERTSEAPVAVVAAAGEEMVVTLEHSSFGSYTFRAEESKVASSISAAVQRAKLEHSVRVGVAKIDAEQAALEPERAKIYARVAAAETLNDAVQKSREERALERVQGQSQELIARREKLLESLLPK